MLKLTKPMHLYRWWLGCSDKFDENTLQFKLDFD